MKRLWRILESYPTKARTYLLFLSSSSSSSSSSYPILLLSINNYPLYNILVSSSFSYSHNQLIFPPSSSKSARSRSLGPLEPHLKHPVSFETITNFKVKSCPQHSLFAPLNLINIFLGVPLSCSLGHSRKHPHKPTRQPFSLSSFIIPPLY